MSTRLILIRHGSTELSLEKRYCSLTDIDLNEIGISQAKSLYQRLNKEKIHRFYSSDLRRALKFAKIVFRGHSIKKLSELREIDFGLFEGLTHKEAIKKYYRLYKKWLNNPFGVNIPYGDSLNDFKKRINRILKKIIALNKDKTVAIVTHAGPIKIIVCGILKSKDIWGIKIDLASLSIIDFQKDKSEIRLLNDTSHLDG